MIGYPSLKPKEKASFRELGREVSAVIDKDFIQVRRQVGQFGFMDIYENCPCHIILQTGDNPNPTATSSNPVIIGIAVMVEPLYDIRNGDRVFLKIMNGETNSLLAWYSGVLGMPYANESRKIIQMESWALGQIGGVMQPTPPEFIPPPHPLDAMVEINNFEIGTGDSLRGKQLFRVRIGDSFTIDPQEMTAWTLEAFDLDGTQHSYSDLPYTFTVDRKLHVITYLWTEYVSPNPFFVGVWRSGTSERFRDNAWVLRTGAHFDMLLTVADWEENGDIATFRIISDQIRTTGAFVPGMGYVHHESRGNVFIDTSAHAMLSTSTVFLTQPQQEYWQVINPRPVAATRTVTAQRITPTQAMLDSAVITWTWDD